jgi:predicted glutamine amidotransferase
LINTGLADGDGAGDRYITTTEEKDGWGMVWFENPATT